jgi:nucleotidyltransferase substrate binding protein (TIGR01987 family)
MTERIVHLQPLEQAVSSLKRALEQPKNEFIRDSVIQRFEFTYELAWKALKRYLENDEGGENVDSLSRRDLFRLAAEKGLIVNPLAWFEYHRNRNESSHTYAEAKAEEVFTAAQNFLPDVTALVATLAQKQDSKA